MEMIKNIIIRSVIICGIILISLDIFNNSNVTAKTPSQNDDALSNKYRIPGKIIISFHQEIGEIDYFRMEKGLLSSRLNSAQKLRLNQYGLKKASKFLHRGNRAYYKLSFDKGTNDTEICNYLKSIPLVEHIQYDYRVQFHVEPNDFYYGPDSTSWNVHHVPDSMNIVSPTCNANGGTSRWCGNGYVYDQCCPDEYYVYPDGYFMRDSLHYSDNWYLQFTQANIAWDIQKGDPNVKIMVMDSGVDDEHPDLMANIWTNYNDTPGDDENNGLPGSVGDDDGDGYPNFRDLSYESLDLDKDDHLLWGANNSCDAGLDGDYGLGPDAIDNTPPGPGGGDDDTSSTGYDPWDDNTRGPGSINPSLPFDDDFEDVQFIKRDDDENGYPDDYHGVNCYNPIEDWPEPGKYPDGLPGLKGWDGDVGGVDRDYDGIHFNDDQVKMADFDSDGVYLCGEDYICDAGPDGDYGFGPNAIDDDPPGPDGGDDDISSVGYDPWDDNERGPGSADSLQTFDDDMDDVYYLKYDDYERGNPLYPAKDDCCPKTTMAHGTSMAGIIGAETNNTIGMAGYAWYCKLVPAKIAIGYPENTEWSGDVDGAVEAILKAVYYAIDTKVDIINMSFGFRKGNDFVIPLLDEAFDDAYDAGIICIASAGNDPRDRIYFPASHDKVIAASGIHRTNVWSQSTVYNDSVDICAPIANQLLEEYTVWEVDTVGEDERNYYDRGAECVTTGYYSSPQPWLGNGIEPHLYGVTSLMTSGAAAQTSGLAGLLVSQYPRSQYGGYTSEYVDFIKGEILRGAVPINDDLYDQGKLGAGYINAYRSLTWWGDLDADTTWTGDIYVSTNYAINEGTTLTIAPGTTIHFATHNNDSTGVEDATCALLVRGELIANGTSESPIIFRSIEDNAPAGSWYGIRLLGDAAVATLNHCIIQDAEWGVKSHRTVNMNYCEVSNCNTCGVYLFEENSINESRLAHCNISDNDSIYAVGMRIWNCAEGDTTIVVDSCTVNNNGSDGIWVSNARPWIKHSDMKYNGEDGVYVTTYQSEIIAYPRIIWCRIQENGENGMYFNFVGGYVYATRISDNSSYGIYGYGEGCNALIRYSKIVDQMTGIRLLYAEPNLGNALDATSGHNTINNSTYNVYHTPFFAEIVKAENNYWGSYPPNANKIKKNVDYSPALSSDPVIFLARMEKENSTVLKLFQNYPNPVMSGSSTKISYYLPSREKVVMRIYDVSGRRITTLVDDVQPQGMHYIDWNGKNERGNTVAPGIYFYRMMVGDQIQSKKIVLLKK